MARSVGIREVASRAGVSVGSVSNALNRPETLSASMLSRIQTAMDELGFVRNDLARQLKMGGGTTLGMIVLNVANPFFAALAHASEDAAEALGHTVVLGSSDQLDVRENRYIDLFEEQRVRGMMIAPVGGYTARMRQLRQRGMPFVLFDSEPHDGDFCSVALDGDAAGFLATMHLIDTGRRHIAFLGGPLHQVHDRWAGAMRACATSAGARLSHIDTADQTIADGREAGAIVAAMARDERPDAIFAANDQLALGIMQSLVLAPDIDFPRDIALVGYDDIDYSASAIVPLTTVRQPNQQLAAEAIRLVLDESNNEDEHEHEHIFLAPELIVRESSPHVG